MIFDFDGTLARTVAPWAETHASVLARHGLERFAGGWGSQWELGPADGEEHVEQSASRAAYRRWELGRLRDHAVAHGIAPECIDALVVDLDRATKGTVLSAFDESLAVLGQLRARGLLVAVCSNWYWDLDRSLDAVGLADAVDVAVTSAQAGARKPHPRIYAETLRRCGLRADEALFVGDTWSTDVEGALAAGMPVVHVCRSPRDAEDEPRLPARTWRVADLRAVAAIAVA